ncbi:beta-N-acetylhexosaminidase [Fontibacillus solani]|uniref:Beta-N-acetylhexosaminidase n=1 Tax=Fontibacillus solani TaxID=1572857 RepID=A0A7W3SR11_9BACL|nr:beta-N-acetylhexosaminidase [Fontibacillus solani]MBA9084479.1 beta-N-acetylhexosaminidase [Fontibacillus solani]
MKRSIWASLFIVFVIVIVIGGCSKGSSSSSNGQAGGTEEQQGQNQEETNSSSEPVDPVREQLNQMTTAEKIGQLVLVGMDGVTANANTRELIENYHVGGFIFYKDNITNSEQTLTLINQLKIDNKSSKIPLFLSVDEEGGRVTRLPGDFLKAPSAAKIGATGKVEAASEVGAVIGQQLSGFGLNMDFAPVLDINSNPNNPVIGDRSFGDNADVVSKMGVAAMKGLSQQGIVPVVKHFPGHGDTSVDSHIGLPVVEHNMDRLRELELVPFQNAIAEGADVVMIAHLLMPKLDPDHPASFSKAIIHDLLREELGFEGVVISDDMTMGAITKNYNVDEAAVEFIAAGGNIVLVGHEYLKEKTVIEAIKLAVETGEISEETLNSRVYDVLKLKHKYGLSGELAKGPDVKSINKQLQTVLDKYGVK